MRASACVCDSEAGSPRGPLVMVLRASRGHHAGSVSERAAYDDATCVRNSLWRAEDLQHTHTNQKGERLRRCPTERRAAGLR